MSTSAVNPLSSLSTALADSGTSSSSTSATGLGQGIDVQQFVQYAVADQQAAITSLQTQQTTLSSETSEISKISGYLTSLESAAQALSDPLGAMSGELATSSDANIVTGTASGTASSGTHTITVNSLATTSSYYTSELSSSDSTIGTGSFTIQVGSNAASTVTVDDTDNTLSGLATAINNQDLGVTASVIQDANGYRLALVSNSSGAAGDITVGANSTNLSFTKAVTGANASLTVDGVPISSASNTVANVINGVTLTLNSASQDNPITLNVSQDTSQATDAINNFVSAYNTAITEINGQFNVASDGSGGGPLEEDNTLRDAQTQLLSAAAYSITGSNGIVNLDSIGVTMNDDGTLSVDSGTLNAALTNNYADVQNLMQNATSGFAQNFTTVLNNINAADTGTLSVDSQSITNTSQALSDQINDLQAALAVQEANLTQVYSQVNVTLEELPLLESQTSQQLSSLTS